MSDSSPSMAETSVLKSIGSPLEVLSAPIASPLPSATVLVRVLIVDIASFAKAVFAGYGPVKPPVPLIPGTSGVCVVESVASDVFGVKAGELVLVEPYHVASSNSGSQARLLIGWFSLSDPSSDADAAKQIELYKNGVWATKAVVPASCVHVVPTSLLHRNPFLTVEDLHLVKNMCISYGALVDSEFQAGDKVLVNGASGSYGSWLVLLLLVLNVGRVFVMGRNANALKQLVELDPLRVQAVVLESGAGSESEKKDGGSILDQVKRQLGSDWQTIDRYIDFLGYAQSSESTMAGILALRLRGFAVLAGGVAAELPLHYGLILAKELTIRGHFMYTKSAIKTVLELLPEMVKKFDLGKRIHYHAFDSLKQINEALDSAAKNAAGFNCTVVYPNSKAAATQDLKKYIA